MIKRIVYLPCRKGEGNDLKAYIQTVQSTVASQPGCHGVDLWQDVRDPDLLFTYSTWDNEEALNTYRDGEVFGGVWPKIKSFLGGKPRAWSVNVIE